jgi:thiamine-monophosphate kinase
VNGLFEADCEILRLSKNHFLSISTDSIAEEITVGLYKDIETWSWMSVMSSVSDLAASGSTPLGITLSTQWAFGTSPLLQKRFFAGIRRACMKAKVPLLGGDSGFAKDHVVTSTIVGDSRVKPLTRMGAKAGDYLVLAARGNVGLGPALAFRFLMNAEESTLPEKLFRPAPSWLLAQRIRPVATAAIDTSDGIATSLYTLCQLNNLGFDLQWQEELQHPQALRFCRSQNFSPMMLWMGDHGDFQTLFTVPEKNIPALRGNKNLHILGRLTRQKHQRLAYKNQIVHLPVKEVVQCPRDVVSYKKLFQETARYLARFH